MDVRLDLMPNQELTKLNPKSYEYFETGRIVSDDSFEAENDHKKASKKDKMCLIFNKIIPKSNKDEVQRDIEILKFMRIVNNQKPYLHFSVIGAVEDFSMPEKAKNAFKDGLGKVAHKSLAWITTNAEHTGISKLVGEAISKKSKTPLIQIAPLDQVADLTHKLRYKDDLHEANGKNYDKKYCPIELDPNHNNYFIYEENSENYYRPVTSSLYKKSLLIVFVLGGNFETLKIIEDAIEHQNPIIIFKGTKGIADMIALALETSIDNPELEPLAASLLNNSSFSALKNKIKNIISEDSRHLLNVLKLDFKVTSKNIELTINEAFSKNNKDDDEYQWGNLYAALRFGQIEFAKEFTKKIFNNKEKRDNIFFSAIVFDVPEIISYILDNDFDIEEALTMEKLISLYRNINVTSEFYASEHNLKNEVHKNLKEYYLTDAEVNLLEYKISELHWTNKTFKYPIKNLFIFCLLTNRIEMAKLFWEKDDYHTHNALLASVMLNNMREKFINFKKTLSKSENIIPFKDFTVENLIESSKYFEMAACKVVEAFDNNKSDGCYRNCDFLLQEDPCFIGSSCYELAWKGKRVLFSSTSIMNDLASIVWNNGMYATKNQYRKEGLDLEIRGYKSFIKVLFSVLTFGLFAPFILDKDTRFLTKDEYKEKDFNSNFGKWKCFYKSPKIHFIYDALSKLAFVIFFSYTLLCDFNYDKIDIYAKNDSRKSLVFIQYFTQKNKAQHVFTLSETILYIWYYSIVIDELAKFVSLVIARGKFFSSLKYYFKSKWSYIDILIFSLFFIGSFLRVYSRFFGNANIFLKSKEILAVTLILWYFRILQYTAIIPYVGPKLIAIKKMLHDLVFFSLMFVVVMFGFGIAIQANLRPNSKLGLNLLKDIFDNAYWPTYGELKILDDLDHVCEIEGCELDDGKNFGYLAIMIYMIITHVLLLNLLIAMLNSTFEKVENRTDQIWKFQRLTIVMEYANKDFSVLAPPFSLVVAILFNFYIVTCLKKTRDCLCARKNSSHDTNHLNYISDNEFALKFCYDERSNSSE